MWVRGIKNYRAPNEKIYKPRGSYGDICKWEKQNWGENNKNYKNNNNKNKNLKKKRVGICQIRKKYTCIKNYNTLHVGEKTILTQTKGFWRNGRDFNYKHLNKWVLKGPNRLGQRITNWTDGWLIQLAMPIMPRLTSPSKMRGGGQKQWETKG